MVIPLSIVERRRFFKDVISTLPDKISRYVKVMYNNAHKVKIITKTTNTFIPIIVLNKHSIENFNGSVSDFNNMLKASTVIYILLSDELKTFICKKAYIDEFYNNYSISRLTNIRKYSNRYNNLPDIISYIEKFGRQKISILQDKNTKVNVALYIVDTPTKNSKNLIKVYPLKESMECELCKNQLKQLIVYSIFKSFANTLKVVDKSSNKTINRIGTVCKLYDELATQDKRILHCFIEDFDITTNKSLYFTKIAESYSS